MTEMSETEKRARRVLGDEVVDQAVADADEAPPLTQAQKDFLRYTFGPLVRAAAADREAKEC